jgi:hypothetical protein
MKKALAVVVVLAIVATGVAWKKDKLNKVLPAKLQHHDGFIGLNRSGVYVMGPGGKPGRPGTDLNISDWV